MKGRETVLAALLTVGVVGTAGAASPLAGNWEGTLRMPRQSLRLAFHIQEAGNRFTGTMDSPDQGVNGVPLDAVRRTTGGVYLESSRIKGTYTGMLSKDGTTLTGEWKQGQSLPLTLERPRGEASALGDWQGSLNVPGRPIRLVVHLATSGRGKIQGTLDSPDQGQNGIPIEEAVLSRGQLRFTSRSIGGIFTGTVQAGGKRVTGEWWQGVTLPLTLRKR
jgi:uncharacterized protein